MNTAENNKLLAEFLRWCKGTHQRKVTNPKHPEFKRKQPIKEVYLLEDSHPIVENIYTDLPGFYWDYDKEDENGNTVNRLKFFPEDLKFHTDWNWLMLVVNKIESLGYRIEIVRHICRVYLSDTQTIIISENLTKIEAVHNACIEFVKWNKEQK